jgi:hypothetical protein
MRRALSPEAPERLQALVLECSPTPLLAVVLAAIASRRPALVTSPNPTVARARTTG